MQTDKVSVTPIETAAYKLTTIAELMDNDVLAPERLAPLSERGRMGLRKILEEVADSLIDVHDELLMWQNRQD